MIVHIFYSYGGLDQGVSIGIVYGSKYPFFHQYIIFYEIVIHNIQLPTTYCLLLYAFSLINIMLLNYIYIYIYIYIHMKVSLHSIYY